MHLPIHNFEMFGNVSNGQNDYVSKGSELGSTRREVKTSYSNHRRKLVNTSQLKMNSPVTRAETPMGQQNQPLHFKKRHIFGSGMYKGSLSSLNSLTNLNAPTAPGSCYASLKRSEDDQLLYRDKLLTRD